MRVLVRPAASLRSIRKRQGTGAVQGSPTLQRAPPHESPLRAKRNERADFDSHAGDGRSSRHAEAWAYFRHRVAIACPENISLAKQHPDQSYPRPMTGFHPGWSFTADSANGVRERRGIFPTPPRWIAKINLGAAMTTGGSDSRQDGALGRFRGLALPQTGNSLRSRLTAAPICGTALPFRRTALANCGTASPFCGTRLSSGGTALPHSGPRLRDRRTARRRSGTRLVHRGTCLRQCGSRLRQTGTRLPHCGTAKSPRLAEKWQKGPIFVKIGPFPAQPFRFHK